MHTLLIVDDEIPSRELIKMSLDWAALGFTRLLEARNGRDALALCARERPDLIITDIQMPVMDGLEFIREARRRDPAQRILILSCHERFAYAKEAMRLGVLDYILKDSITESSLLAAVSTALGRLSEQELRALDAHSERIQHALRSRDPAQLNAEVARLFQTDLTGARRTNQARYADQVLQGLFEQALDADGSQPDMGPDPPNGDIEALCAWHQARFSALLSAPRLIRSPRVRRAQDYLDIHFCEDVSLESLAARLQINKGYLAKVFKAELGVSVNEYIRDKRIARAKQMLRQPDARVGELVEWLGFHNPQTFYNLFKRATGMSPSEYKALADALPTFEGEEADFIDQA